MFDRAPFLGQVPIRGLGQAQIRDGSGFMGPFGIYSDIGAPGGYAPPPGFPATTEEMLQTYICPDGSHQQMLATEAASRGCVPAPPTGPYARVASPGLMGRQRMGQNGPPAGGPPAGGPPTQQGVAPTVVGSPTTSEVTQFFPPAFGWPLGYPGYVPPSSGRMTCKKIVDDVTGEETFECETVAPPVGSTYRYPVHFMNPFFF